MTELEVSKRPYLIKDITSLKSGMITAIAFVGIQNKKAMWKCHCACGNDFIASSNNLQKGYYVSCGCLRKDRIATYSTSHGMSGTPEHRAWKQAKSRCCNQNDRAYSNYAGRGITMCDEWLNNFVAFFQHIGPRPNERMSLDRIDNDKGYEPGNVRWATATQQANNQRKRKSLPPRNTKGQFTTLGQ